MLRVFIIATFAVAVGAGIVTAGEPNALKPEVSVPDGAQRPTPMDNFCVQSCMPDYRACLQSRTDPDTCYQEYSDCVSYCLNNG
jgi:hypothetical protein